MTTTSIPGRLALAGATFLAGLILLSPPCFGGLVAKKPEEFAKGMQALKMEKWKNAAELFRKSLDQAEEDGTRTRIYGMGYAEYLPRFYLGLVLYRQGNCGEAVQEWDRSEKQGPVRESEEYNSLLLYRENCQRRLRSTPTIKLPSQPSSTNVVKPPIPH